jgi:hypothetical protein
VREPWPGAEDDVVRFGHHGNIVSCMVAVAQSGQSAGLWSRMAPVRIRSVTLLRVVSIRSAPRSVKPSPSAVPVRIRGCAPGLRSSGDRAPPSGGGSAGSNPAWGHTNAGANAAPASPPTCGNVAFVGWGFERGLGIEPTPGWLRVRFRGQSAAAPRAGRVAAHAAYDLVANWGVRPRPSGRLGRRRSAPRTACPGKGEVSPQSTVMTRSAARAVLSVQAWSTRS